MRKSVAIVLLNLVLLSGAAAVLSACNTTAGAGQDVSAAGHAVTNSADKVKAGL
jgi:predicted small secreted protein